MHLEKIKDNEVERLRVGERRGIPIGENGNCSNARTHNRKD